MGPRFCGPFEVRRSLGLSDDILIVGLDDYSLYRYGQLPLDKSLCARFILLFSRIRDRGLAASMLESGRVVMPTSFVWTGEAKNLPDRMARQQRLDDRLGSLRKIKGPWESMGVEETVNPPLGIYASAASGYGRGDFRTDQDGSLRRETLVVRSAALVEELSLEDLKPGFTGDASRFEYLQWRDMEGGSWRPRHWTDTGWTARAWRAGRGERRIRSMGEDSAR